MAVKKNKKRKSVLWLRQWTTGRTPSHLQSHTAAVYIATRSAWVLWGSKHWAESADSVCCLCGGCSRLAIIAPPSMHRAMHSLHCTGQRWYQFLRASMLRLMCPSTTTSTHQVQWTCLQLLRPGCMELTACRHPVHDEQTNFQNITEISFLPSSFWYFIVTTNCLLLGAHVLIVMGALHFLHFYIDDDDDDELVCCLFDLWRRRAGGSPRAPRRQKNALYKKRTT